MCDGQESWFVGTTQHKQHVSDSWLILLDNFTLDTHNEEELDYQKLTIK